MRQQEALIFFDQSAQVCIRVQSVVCNNNGVCNLVSFSEFIDRALHRRLFRAVARINSEVDGNSVSVNNHRDRDNRILSAFFRRASHAQRACSVSFKLLNELSFFLQSGF